jgi:hypothetical protein
MESLSNALIYHFEFPTLNGITKILLHDETKEELKKKNQIQS